MQATHYLTATFLPFRATACVGSVEQEDLKEDVAAFKKDGPIAMIVTCLYVFVAQSMRTVLPKVEHATAMWLLVTGGRFCCIRVDGGFALHGGLGEERASG